MFALNHRLRRLALALALVPSFFVGNAAPSLTVQAAGLVVNTLADNTATDGLCSLREAITNANNNTSTHADCGPGSGTDIITFALSGVVVLGSTLPLITDPAGLTIEGAGQSITISGNDLVRPFWIDPGGVLEVRQVSVTRGLANSLVADYNGGAFLNYNGTLTITRSTVSGNVTNLGGGAVSNYGVLHIVNSTLSGNSARTGGAIMAESGSSTFITNSTIAANVAEPGGIAGIYAGPANVTISNSVLANTGFLDCRGNFTLVGPNLFEDPGPDCSIDGATPIIAPAGLGLLTDNGGATHTHALLIGSQARDIAGGAICATAPVGAIDQRGFARPGGIGCDLGAYEAESLTTLTVSDVTSVEGSAGTSSATFAVSLGGVAAAGITVQYATTNGTAEAGTDYLATSGTLIFALGETVKVIPVALLGDTLVEPDETFTLTLSNPTNAVILKAIGLATIQNDDGPTLSIGDAAALEGDSGSNVATFTVTLGAASPTAAGVQYTTVNGTASAGLDYVATSGTLNFAPGETVKAIMVSILGDGVFELDETFFVNLANPTFATLGDAQGQGTITNDDPLPSLTIGDVSLMEGNSEASSMAFTVTLSAPSSVNVVVQYATANGTALAGPDYVPTSGALTFTPGETAKAISVSVLGDRTFEPTETFFINLSSPTNAMLGDGQATGVISNDDTEPTMSIADVSWYEGLNDITRFGFSVTLSNASYLPITVQYASADGSATAGVDYTAASGTLTFNPGEVGKSVTINVLGDDVVEETETFLVNLSNATNATIADDQGLGTITSDDIPPAATFMVTTLADDGPGSLRQAIADANVSEGVNAILFSISGTVVLAAPLPAITDSAGVTIDASGRAISIDGGGAVRPFTVNNAAALTIRGLTISNGIRALKNDGGTVTILDSTISNNSFSSSSLLGTQAGGIWNVAGTLSIINTTVSGNSVVSTSGLGGATGGGIWNGGNLTLANSTVSGNSATGNFSNAGALWSAGSTTISNSTITGNTLNSGTPGAGGIAGSGLIVQNSIVAGNFGPSFPPFGEGSDCLGPISAVGPNLGLAGPCTISGIAPLNGASLLGPLTDNGGTTKTHALLPGSPAIDAGDDVLCGQAPVLSLDQRGGVRPGGARCDLGAYEKDAVSGLSTTSAGALEGGGAAAATNGPSAVGTVVFTIRLSAPSTVTVVVSYATANGTALAGADYVPVMGVLTFAPGEVIKTVPVTVINDAVAEPDESFYLNLSSASQAILTTTRGVGTIVNYDTGTPDINVTPLVLDFGNNGVGALSPPQQVTVQNTGTGSLSVGASSVAGANAPDFVKSADTCSGHYVLPAAQCTISLRFQPSVAGLRTATLTIPSNDPDESPVHVTLSGIGAAPTGGRNLTITTGSIDLSWDGGTAQNSYTLLKYNTSTALAELLPVAGNATSFSDVTATNGFVYCYVLAALNGPTFLGLSDLLCGMAGQESGTVIPLSFALKLGGTANATMTWSAPVGGVDSYLLQVIPLDGSPIVTIPLSGASTTTIRPVTLAGTCFQLLAFKGGAYGTSDVLCGVPGVGTLGADGGRVASVAEAAALITERVGWLDFER